MRRLRSRIIGVKGKARERIEELSGCSVSVYGTTIAIIGDGRQVDRASRAIILLLQGSEHSTDLPAAHPRAPRGHVQGPHEPLAPSRRGRRSREQGHPALSRGCHVRPQRVPELLPYRTPAFPLRFARREFAAFPFGSALGMRRHMAFGRADGSGSSSSGRCRGTCTIPPRTTGSPTTRRWRRRGGSAADVIFDLDADHLRGAEALSYPEQLALVKEKFVMLLDEFLFRDFGIDPAETLLAFFRWPGLPRAPPGREPAPPHERRATGARRVHPGDRGRSPVRDPRGAGAEQRGRAGSRTRMRAARSARVVPRAGRAYVRLQPPDATGWAGARQPLDAATPPALAGCGTRGRRRGAASRRGSSPRTPGGTREDRS